MRPLADCRLYTFVDTAYLRGRDPVELTRQLCEGGADLVQLRAKDWSKAKIQRVGEQLLAVTQAWGVWLVINDHPDMARAVGAPLCHLGQEDFFDAGWSHVRHLPDVGAAEKSAQPLGIGLSTHAPAQAERAVAAGAAYVAVGPVYPTPTKPGRAAVTPAYVRWAAAHLTVPWFAIGGLTLETLEEVLAAGARRICVVSAILNAPDVAQACREFRRRLA